METWICVIQRSRLSSVSHWLLRGCSPCMINLLWVFFWGGGLKCYFSFQLPVSSYKQFVMPAVTLLAPVSSVKQPNYHIIGMVFHSLSNLWISSSHASNLSHLQFSHTFQFKSIIILFLFNSSFH